MWKRDRGGAGGAGPHSPLTALRAQHKQELGRHPLHVGVQVRHEANQFVPQQLPHLRPGPHVPQWGQHLRGQLSLSLGLEGPGSPTRARP